MVDDGLDAEQHATNFDVQNMIADALDGGGRPVIASGWRDVYEDGTLLVMRAGASVVVIADGTTIETTALTIPEGFRPAWPSSVPDFAQASFGYSYDQGNDAIRTGIIRPDADHPGDVIASSLFGGLQDLRPRWEYVTTDALPAELPGIEAS